MVVACCADLFVLNHPDLDPSLRPYIAFFGLTKAVWCYFSYDKIFREAPKS